MKKIVKFIFFMIQAIFVFYVSASTVSEVTKDIVEQHYKSFLVFIDKQSNDIWMLQAIPFEWVAKKAVKVDGYNDFSYECIKAVYSFFGRIKDKKYLVKVMTALPDYGDHIDGIVQRYRIEKPANVNSLFRITHEETIKRASLPEHINKQELFASHAKCRQVAHHIKQEDQDLLIAAGLFAKYWVEVVRK